MARPAGQNAHAWPGDGERRGVLRGLVGNLRRRHELRRSRLVVLAVTAVSLAAIFMFKQPFVLDLALLRPLQHTV